MSSRSWAAAAWGLRKEGLGNDDTHDLNPLGALGVIAARQGRGEDARRISAELRDLTRPHLSGRHTLWRARIAAALNEPDRALTLLREAFAQGQNYGYWLHTDVAFEDMRGHPGFRELLEPKG